MSAKKYSGPRDPRKLRYVRDYNRRYRTGVKHPTPRHDDPRWRTEPEFIFEQLHIRRRRAWVKWRGAEVTHSRYRTPHIGLVVKPLDTYQFIAAIIVIEEPICLTGSYSDRIINRATC